MVSKDLDLAAVIGFKGKFVTEAARLPGLGPLQHFYLRHYCSSV